MVQLATFWSGPLTPMETACLLSFVQRGHVVTLYSYDDYTAPAGITLKSAAEILDPSFLYRFRTDGKPNIAHFADLFRLVLFQKTDNAWVDCDVLCLEPAGSPWPDDLIIREGADSIINCVLHIRDQALLKAAIGLTEAMLDRELPWAATQNIIPRAIESSGYGWVPIDKKFYSPINVDDWHKFLLPEFKAECEQLCADAKTVHIYNNILQKVGYLKSALPPEGSYLRALLDARDLSQLFNGVYTEQTVRNLAANWRMRFSGESVGLGALARQLVPAMRRTVARHRFR